MKNFNSLSDSIEEITEYFESYYSNCPCCNLKFFTEENLMIVTGALLALERNSLFHEFIRSPNGLGILLQVMIGRGLINYEKPRGLLSQKSREVGNE